jgi:cell division initiation protein
MALTPVEIRHLTPPRTAFRGYRAGPTEKLLEEIALSFEDVWRERADLADKVEQLESDLVRFRELESLLRTTLVSAEQASAQMRDQARREAQLMLAEAHAEAREIQRRAVAENDRLALESRRLRAQLIDALSAFEEPAPAAEVERKTEPEPRAAGEQDADAEAERSWYGYPSGGTALPDADAA